MLVDSHCHLENNQEIEDIIARANKVGVELILNVGSNLDNIKQHLDICDRFDGIYTAAGVHPHQALEFEELRVDDIIDASDNSKVIAIGEAGLDYYYDFAPKEAQIKLFEKNILAAQETGKPLIIHNRESDDDMINILQKAYEKKEFKAIIHCYSSSWFLAEKTLEMGFYISASGMITFPRSEDIRNNFKKIPLEKILLETDSPYLAPVPRRGQVNEPANVIWTAEKMAEVKNVSFEKICEITTNNFKRLFSL